VRKPQVLLLGAAAAAAALTLTAVPASASVAHPAAGTKASGHATTARPQESPYTCSGASWPTDTGLFGVVPGSGNRGGISGSLWVTTETSNATRMEDGNSSDNQQWCELAYPDSPGGYALASLVTGTWYCLTIPAGGAHSGGLVYSDPCDFGVPNNEQEWRVCSEGDGSYSFQPIESSLWLTAEPNINTVNGDFALENGNGGDAQAFTTYDSYTGHEDLEPLAANC
jgi:hypothetical protein